MGKKSWHVRQHTLFDVKMVSWFGIFLWLLLVVNFGQIYTENFTIPTENNSVERKSTLENVTPREWTCELKQRFFFFLPTEFDWRQYGKVTPVKDQKECNACYAFVVTSVVESSLAIYYSLEVRTKIGKPFGIIW